MYMLLVLTVIHKNKPKTKSAIYLQLAYLYNKT